MRKLGAEQPLDIREHLGIDRLQTRFRRARPVRCGIVSLHKRAKPLGNYVELNRRRDAVLDKRLSAVLIVVKLKSGSCCSGFVHTESNGHV